MEDDEELAKDDITEAEREILVSFYGFARDEIITESQIINKRITQGLAVIAAIIGYGLFRDSLWIVAFTPFVFAIIFLQLLKTIKGIAKDAQFMINIESRLKHVTPLANFESCYGAFYGDSVGEGRLILTLDRLGEYAEAVIAIIGYFFMIWLGYVFWDGRPVELSQITHSDLLLSYFLITALVLSVAIISIRYFLNLKPE